MPRTMIDYAILCQAIEAWKTGRPAAAAPVPTRQHPPRPSRPAAAAPTPAAPVEEEVVEYSGLYESDAPAEPVESTVIYQLPDYENVEVSDDDQ